MFGNTSGFLSLRHICNCPWGLRSERTDNRALKNSRNFGPVPDIGLSIAHETRLIMSPLYGP
jgi:hypothetical protein